jgi:hypothetical protein
MSAKPKLNIHETAKPSFKESLAADAQFNTLLANSVKANELAKNSAIHVAKYLLARFGDTISLLPKPDSQRTANQKGYRGEPEGNDLFPKYDKYELEKVERGTPRRSFYGDLVDSLPIGQAIAEEIEAAKASNAQTPDGLKVELSRLNTNRTNAVITTKKAVNIGQQVEAVNAMDGVKADFSERLEIKTGEYVLDGTIRVEDTSAGRVRAFKLLSVPEFLRLNVEKAKGMGGTYAHLLSTLIQQPKATDDKVKTYKAGLKTAVKNNFKEAQDAVGTKGGMPADAIQQILVGLEKKFLDILEA